jgi:hypothetical protein
MARLRGAALPRPKFKTPFCTSGFGIYLGTCSLSRFLGNADNDARPFAV